MKKLIAISAIVMAQAAQAQGEWKWDEVFVNSHGVAASMIESYTHRSYLGVFADPKTGCNPTLSSIETAKDDWAQGSFPVEFQVKVDHHPLWFVNTDLVNDGEAAQILMVMSDELMDQFANGKEIITRGKVRSSNSWTETARFRLHGSAEALNDIIATCLRLQNDEKWWEPEQEWQS